MRKSREKEGEGEERRDHVIIEKWCTRDGTRSKGEGTRGMFMPEMVLASTAVGSLMI